MHITLKQIEVFTAIAKTSNVSQAAKHLHLSQSACSMALSALENQLGGILFDRHGKRLSLNDQGKVLFLKADNILSQLKEFQYSMSTLKTNNLAGDLMIGASTTIGNYLLPEIIGQFLNNYPKVDIKLRIANTEEIIHQLLLFNIDIGIVEGSCTVDKIEIIPWRKDQLVVIAAKNHLLSRKNKISFSDLCSAKWILREPGSGTRKYFERAMGTKIYPFLELGHAEAIKQAVSAGLGISCLSKLTLSHELKSKQLVILKTPFLNLSRDFFILMHKEKYQTVLLKAFMTRLND